LFVQENNSALVATGEYVVVDLVFATVPAAVTIFAQDRKHSDVVAPSNKILGDDLPFGSVQKNSGTGGAALAQCAGLGVADIPDDIVVDLILGAVHFHVDAGADSYDVRKDISSYSAIGVPAV
jgi:hypothetical protein